FILECSHKRAFSFRLFSSLKFQVRLVEIRYISFRKIRGPAIISNPAQDHCNPRNDHGISPCLGIQKAHRNKEGKNNGHHHLGDTSAQIAPTRRGSIGGAYNVWREHHRSMVLGNDKGSTDDTNGQTEKQKTLIAIAHADKNYRNRSKD